MNPTAAVTLDRDTLGLADVLTATVRVEGVGPLVVVLPKEVLLPESAAAWQARPVGAAVLAPLPGGRESWTLTLRLDPFVPGDAVPLAFAPLSVKSAAGETNLELPAKAVKVTTTIRDPKPADARPVTGYLDPPAPLPAEASAWLPAAGIGVFVILLAAVAVRRRRPAAVPPPTPAERLRQLADRWAANAVVGREFAEELAAVVRSHLEGRYAVPATRRATGELADAAPLDRFKEILDWCDRAKFGRREPEACGDVLARTQELFAQAGTSSSS